MKYRITPFNIASIITIIWAIMIYNSKIEIEILGNFGFIPMASIGTLGIIMDFFIQGFSKKYLFTIVFEFIILLSILFLFLLIK